MAWGLVNDDRTFVLGKLSLSQLPSLIISDKTEQSLSPKTKQKKDPATEMLKNKLKGILHDCTKTHLATEQLHNLQAVMFLQGEQSLPAVAVQWIWWCHPINSPRFTVQSAWTVCEKERALMTPTLPLGFQAHLLPFLSPELPAPFKIIIHASILRVWPWKTTEHVCPLVSRMNLT